MSNHPNVLVITLNTEKRAATQASMPAAEPTVDATDAPATDEIARLLSSYQEHNQHLTEEGVELNGKLIDATLENKRLLKLLKDVTAGARQDRNEVERLRLGAQPAQASEDEKILLRSTQMALAQTEADLAEARRLLQEATLRNENALAALRTEPEAA